MAHSLARHIKCGVLFTDSMACVSQRRLTATAASCSPSTLAPTLWARSYALIITVFVPHLGPPRVEQEATAARAANRAAAAARRRLRSCFCLLSVAIRAHRSFCGSRAIPTPGTDRTHARVATAAAAAAAAAAHMAACLPACLPACLS
eukprot:COSAG05_NODE_5072_length_1271_cov_10.886131_1_plen_148_part_00